MIEPVTNPDWARHHINWAAVALELLPLLSLPLLIVAEDHVWLIWLPLVPGLATGLGWWLIDRGTLGLTLSAARILLFVFALLIVQLSAGPAFKCFEGGPRCDDDEAAGAVFAGSVLAMALIALGVPVVSAILVGRASRHRSVLDAKPHRA